MSNFFINRPIFAIVLAILISVGGLFSALKIPLERYPDIAPTIINIAASMPGASSSIIENSVTKVIEESLIGLDGLQYFSSSSSSDGSVLIILTFNNKTNPDIAQIQVQNKLQTAMPFLPESLKEQGIVVSKGSKEDFIVFALTPKDDSVSFAELNDILINNAKEALGRIPGVGDLNLYAQPSAMRIWLNPNKLFAFNLSAHEVMERVKNHNSDINSGELGALPFISGSQLNAGLVSSSKLKTVKEFENIILKSTPEGGLIKLKDIAKIEIGPEDYRIISRYRNKPVVAIGTSLTSGANALDVAHDIKKLFNEIKKSLPETVELVISYDRSPFIRLTLQAVVQTLIEAFILVFIIMFLFLQNVRATLIVSLTIPVVLLGGVGVISALGFSINVLTMFAMILAIGLLIDDAIVVVENVERIMHEEKLSPIEATKKSMRQIQGAMIAIALVLSAVFIPMAFFESTVGIIYRQFSVTITSIMALSVIVALILTPSLCAILLKPYTKNDLSESRFFKFFNKKIDLGRNFYVDISQTGIRRSIRFFIIYLALISSAVFLFKKMPLSFLPEDDQGWFLTAGTLPTLSTLDASLQTVIEIEKYYDENESENFTGVYSYIGRGFGGVSQNGFLLVPLLKEPKYRKRKDQSDEAIIARANAVLPKLTNNPSVISVAPPAISGLGSAAGFEMQLIDRGNFGRELLMEAKDKLLQMASESKIVTGVRQNALEDVSQYVLDINYTKAAVLGVEKDEIRKTLEIAFGSAYINNFILNNKVRKVIIQGEAKYRMKPEDIMKWFVKNNKGEQISFSSFAKGKWTRGPQTIERFNGMPSINIQGGVVAGKSSGEAMQEMERLASMLPLGIDIAWSGLSYEEKASGSNTIILYAISVLFIFLALAALYESWLIPFAVIMTIPFGIVGSLLFSTIGGQSNDVFFQLALLTTAGLSAKNAILIVEFIKDLYEKGYDILTATKMALMQRFRPIIMTSIAFMMGVLPLIMASGAGSKSQNALGIAVFGGMATATFILPAFVPLFFVFVQKFSKK